VSATATIIDVFCVKEATGTDLGNLAPVIQDAFNSTLPRELTPGISPGDAVRSIAGLVAAFDAVRSDPDDLYITTATQGDIANSIWPEGGATNPILGGQSVQPNVALEFDNRLNVSLFDFDSGSADDLLGSVQILESERDAGELTKFAFSTVEASAYYITYSVT
jgi:hypothetical protein